MQNIFSFTGLFCKRDLSDFTISKTRDSFIAQTPRRHSSPMLQPGAFGVSFNPHLQSQSHWSLFNGTWQKRPRELDHRLRFETEEMTLVINATSTSLCSCLRAYQWSTTTGWRRIIGSRKLQIIFHKRATKYRSLLRKMTYKDKGSYESSPPCIITGWRRPIGCLRLQVIFCKRATNHRALWRKMT